MWWLNSMTKTSSNIKLQGRDRPSRLTMLLPLVVAIPYLIMMALLITALSGCGPRPSLGQFELDLQSSVFGDITIEQGGQHSAYVVIDRTVGGMKFPEAIELSLIDPPPWLDYRFESNPVAADNNILSFSVKPHATPGIYRLQLHGRSKVDNTPISDSFTFHIKVTESPEDNRPSREITADKVSNRLFAGWFN